MTDFNRQSRLGKFCMEVSKRCGISPATLTVALPAAFDYIREQLCREDGKRTVMIDSFGTLCVIDVPEREYHYTYRGADEMRRLPARRTLRFYPAKSLKREVADRQFDPSRRSFTHHPDDPLMRRRKYSPMKPGKSIPKSQTKIV